MTSTRAAGDWGSGGHPTAHLSCPTPATCKYPRGSYTHARSLMFTHTLTHTLRFTHSLTDIHVISLTHSHTLIFTQSLSHIHAHTLTWPSHTPPSPYLGPLCSYSQSLFGPEKQTLGLSLLNAPLLLAGGEARLPALGTPSTKPLPGAALLLAVGSQRLASAQSLICSLRL